MCFVGIGSATGQTLDLIETDAAITVKHRGRSLVVYNKVSPPVPDGMNPLYERSGFLHPVSSPAGRTVTAIFPADHPHQHGIFSAWVKTTYRGQAVDFWNLVGGTGRVVHERVVSTFDRADATGFEVDLLHRAVKPPAVDVLRERWKVSVYPTDGTYVCFDLESTQQAITPEPLVVQKYHYGGMALRGPVRWLDDRDSEVAKIGAVAREPSAFLNDDRSDRIKGNHQRSKWVALSGTMEGEPVSIAVLCHADNFKSPQAARLHPTKPYFCFAPCVNGAFEIDREHPLHSRYRYVITDAPPDPEWLDQQWNEWCGSCAVDETDDPIYSGPQAGERMGPMPVELAYGESAGRTIDLVEAAAGRPTMLVIVSGANRPAAQLSRALLNYAEMIPDDRVYAALVWLDKDRSAAGSYLKQAISWWGVGPPVGISLDGAEGPGGYGLNRNVNVTVLIARDRTVVANYALVQPSLIDATKILGELSKLTGNRVPTTSELAFLATPTRKLRSAPWTAAPADVQFRKLLCDVLAAPDAEALEQAVKPLIAYVGADAERRLALGRIAAMLTTGRRAVKTPAADQLLRRWRREFE